MRDSFPARAEPLPKGAEALMASSAAPEGVTGTESSLAGYRASGDDFDLSNEAKVAELRHSIAKAFNAGDPDLPSNQV